MRETTLAGLKVRLTGGADREGGGDGPLVVLLHGYGAPGDDLLPLWRVLDVPTKTRFAFPCAPIVLPGGFGGRAWWEIPRSLFEDAARGTVRDRTEDVPAGLAEARAQVSALLEGAAAELGTEKIVIGGFSQGAMLSLDVALHAVHKPVAIVLLSGTLIARNEWTSRLASLRGVRALQSHGEEDPLLPFSVALELRNLLVAGGVPVDWSPFRGGHQIPDGVLDRLGAFLTDVTG